MAPSLAVACLDSLHGSITCRDWEVVADVESQTANLDITMYNFCPHSY